MVLAGPFAGVLLVLVLAGELGFGVAAAGAAVAAAALWLPVRRHLSDLSRFADRLNRLDAGSAPERLHLESPLVSRRLASAFADSTAALHQRLGDLATSSASAETVLDSLPDPVIAIDGDRRIVRASRSTTALLGVDPVGADLVAALRDPGVLEAAERVIATGTAEEIDFHLAGSDLEPAARIAALPEPAPDGTLALIAVTDVTAIRRHGRTRADFVANASHELRTPISVLLGCIETLRGPAREDRAAFDRFLGMMGTQAERMSRLVNDLLSLSKIELNEHLPPSSAVSLSSVIPPVVDSLQFAARSRRIALSIDGDIAQAEVVGERDELIQLFQNLIDNAIKYGAEGSSVGISIGGATPDGPGDRTQATGSVRVAVSDQGEGIPAEHLQRLTERFYRVDTARSREMGGTGLGLAIVKHIVNRHRGELAIESELGVGSVFTVRLPRADPEPDAPEQARVAETVIKA
ncbi:MAG: ATP-binding protein [Defluviicoccus sp.]|nr:ATP-binding protein [Defluviicoccus sp.]